MPAKIKIADLPLDQIKQDFYNGMSLRDISLKLSISEPTLKNILHELNLKRVGRISQRDIDNVISNKQYHISKIVEITGLDKTTVNKILQIHDITPTKIKKKINLPKKPRYEEFKEQFAVSDVTVLLSRSLYYACIQTGYSEPILRRYADEFDIPFVKAFVTINDISLEDREKIKMMFIENLYTNREIQSMFIIGARTLRKITKGLSKITLNNTEFEQYKKTVRRLTTVVKNLFNVTINKGEHVDHKMSVYDGFKQNVSPYLIASMENLEIITAISNLKKGSSSSITKDELYRLHGII